MSEQKYAFLTRMGDHALILSQQLCKLCGKGPALEEDMALANVALDLIGQARLWLQYAADVQGAGGDEDKLAFLRDAHQFHNFLLVEQPNGNYADTLMRQFFFDTWHYFRLQALSQSADARIAEIALKSVKEVTYHVRRTGDLIVRLGDGTEESHARVQAAANELWMYTGEMFEADDVELAEAAAGGTAPASDLRQPWLEHVSQVFAEATLALPSPEAWMQKGGLHGRHTEQLGYILAEMQYLQRAYPASQW
jgi:ring-1,2-phenylacetyl-CoA epoxidase subunit PaaC